jgi:hypothetical protein
MREVMRFEPTAIEVAAVRQFAGGLECRIRDLEHLVDAIEMLHALAQPTEFGRPAHKVLETIINVTQERVTALAEAIRAAEQGKGIRRASAGWPSPEETLRSA